MSKNHWQAVFRSAGAVVSGILLALAFPPFESPEAAWVGLIPLFLVCRWTAPARSFLYGIAAGLVFWLVSLSWLLFLYKTWGYLPAVTLAWLALGAYCSLYFGLFAFAGSWVLRRWWKFGAGSDGAGRGITGWLYSSLQGVGVMLVLAVLWVGFEYLRSLLFTGFPWNALGISQYSKITFIQMAEWTGVYGVSALVVFVNAAFSLTTIRIIINARQRRTEKGLHAELLTGLIVWLLCWAGGIGLIKEADRHAAAGSRAFISCVQPDVKQVKKWTKEHTRHIYGQLRQYTEIASMGDPDLIVWPETAVPGYLGAHEALRDHEAMTFVKEMGRKYGPILAGAMETSYSENGEVEYFNSSFMVDRKGQTDEIYRKQHLVPFGEYVPLEGVFPALERFSPLGWSCTAGSTSTVFRVPVSRTDFEDRTAAFSVLICFEDIFAYLSRDAVLSGAQLLINQTNDAWFDGSAGAEQHLSHCVFRAVENRVPVVRCANTGVTCGIDAAGRTRVFELEDGTRTGFEGAQAYRVRVPRADSGRTFYTRFGDVFFGLPCAVVSGVLTAFFMVRRRRECRLKRGSRIA